MIQSPTCSIQVSIYIEFRGAMHACMLDTGTSSYFASRLAEESSSNILLFNVFCSHWNYYY